MLTCQWYLFNPARFTGSTTLPCSRRWRIYQTCVHSEPMSCHSMAEIVTVTLKTAKSSSNPPLLRYQALVTLRKSIITVKRAVTDATMKDILKKMRGNILIRHCLFSVHQLSFHCYILLG
ncbi:hypothetical protein Ac2012v2_006752 [Leucoagaricus gongylophorus]